MGFTSDVTQRAKAWLKPRLFRISDERFRRSVDRRAGRIAAVRAARPPAPAHVVLAPSGQGNLGDEAMLTSIVRNLRARGVGRIVIVAREADDRFDGIDPDLETVHAPNLMRPTGWDAGLDAIERVLEGATHFVVVGADVLDGGYFLSGSVRRILIADLAARAGLETTIVGFSYKADDHPWSRSLLAAASARMTLCPRDPESAARVRAFARGPVHLVADTAFLLEPAQDLGPRAQALMAWLDEQRAAGRVPIVFNANPLSTGVALGAGGSDRIPDLAAEARRFAATLEHLLALRPELALLFVAHDYRGTNNDVDFMRAILDAGGPTLRERSEPALADLRAAEVKALCRRVDFAITGRMHLGIAALGAGTPCLFLDFMGKVRGLLQHFGIEDLCFTVDDLREPERFAGAIAAHFDARDDYRVRIEAALPRIKALAAENFVHATATPTDEPVRRAAQV